MLIFILLIGLFGITHIYFDHKSHTLGSYIFKPLTTITIIFFALFISDLMPNHYGQLIIAGLIFSLFGDIFLMLKSDKFIQGLVSFLVAHIFYIVAFYSNAQFIINLPVLTGVFLIGAIFLYLILPHANDLKLPVIVYALILQMMVLSAEMMYQTSSHFTALMALIGAIWFMFSDSVLAFSRFVKPFKGSQAILLASYYIAQTCIAFSVSLTG